jgi:hypothetical protein
MRIFVVKIALRSIILLLFEASSSSKSKPFPANSFPFKRSPLSPILLLRVVESNVRDRFLVVGPVKPISVSQKGISRPVVEMTLAGRGDEGRAVS